MRKQEEGGAAAPAALDPSNRLRPPSSVMGVLPAAASLPHPLMRKGASTLRLRGTV